MKTCFTNRLWALLALLCLGFTSSCSDDDDNELNQGQCVLNRIDFFQNGQSDGSYSQVTYNNQGYITELTEYEDGTIVRSTQLVYNNQNQLVRENFLEDGGNEEGYLTYEYNANGTVSKKAVFQNGQEDYNETYTYDSNRRLIQSLETNQGSTYTSTYSYVGSSQNVSMVMYEQDGAAAGMTTYEDYDDKLNPLQAVKGVVVLGESRNNPRKVISTYSDGSTQVSTYAYTYNNSGYATEVVEKDAGSQDEYKSVFSYSGCQ